MLSCRFDYISVTGCVLDYSDLSNLLVQLDPRWGQTGKPVWFGRSYQKGFKSVLGFSGGFTSDLGGIQFFIIFPGQYCQASEDLLSVIQLLFAHGCSFTRCDIALDDYARRSSFEEVVRAGREGNFSLVDSFKIIQSGLRNAPTSPTCYFGQSDKILRFYDAEVLHGIKADRWELQLRGSYPDVLIPQYLDEPSETFLASAIFESVNFLDRSSDDQHLNRFKRLPFWQSLINEVGQTGLKLSPVKIERSTDKIQRWLESQVAPSLAVLFYGWGEDNFNRYLKSICQDASNRGRLSDWHNAQIDSLRSSLN